MSEFLNFDERGYPSFIVPNGAERIEGCPANTTIYLHGPEFKGVDHIFVQSDEDEQGRPVGPFLWRIVSKKFMDGMFDDFVLELTETGFDVVTADVPAESDLREWEKYVDGVVDLNKITNKGIKKWLKESK